MSDGPKPLAPVPDPDLAALLAQVRSEIFASLNCHEWGIVQSFNAAKQTAVVKIAVLRQVPEVKNGQPAYVGKAYPLLLDVPVFVPTGGIGFLAMPVAPGDTCLVLFNDRDYDEFWASGNVAEPNSARMHDLSDGLALVGFRTSAKPLADYPTDRVKLAYGTTALELASKVKLFNALSSLKVQQQKIIDALTALNAKTGPSAAVAIAAAQTEADNLLA